MKIYLKDAMRRLQLASGLNKTFSITYRKKDGTFGSKAECRNRSGYYGKSKKADLSTITHETKEAGKAYLEYRSGGDHWQPFEIFWCLMITFEGRTIDHRF